MNRADQRKFHYIYRVTRTDGMYYIGLHSTDDLDDGYFGSGQRLWKSIKKHGKEAHTKEILEFLPSRLELRARERELVNEKTLQDPLCMNVILGGSESPMLIQSVRQKVSIKQKEIWANLSDEEVTRRASIGGQAHASKLRSDSEYAAEYSRKQRSKTFKLTKEQCRKISEGNLGKTRSEELKKRLSELATLRPKIKCQHCGKEAQVANLSRWHGDNCKLKPLE